MKFLDNIDVAIQEVKDKNTIFLVIIYDDSDNSKSIDALLSDPAVAKECQEFIGLRLESSSQAAAQFSAIYPVMAVPTIYLIGPTGTPLEVQLGVPHGAQTELLNRITKSKELLHQQQSGDSSTSQASANPALPVAVAASAAEDNTVPSETTAESQPPLSERMEAAQKLLAQKKEARLREEKDKEKQCEVERRQVGRAVGKLREQQREQEARERSAELKREKAETEAARQRVKAQIEADRAERARRMHTERSEQVANQEQQRVEREQEAAASRAQAEAVQNSLIRLQFRRTGHEHITHTFNVEDNLCDVAEWLAQRIGCGVDTFHLAVVYPRRVFTAEDMQRSLMELGLSSSAALAVLPGSSRSGSGSGALQPATGGGIIQLLMAPLLFIWSFLIGLFSGGGGGVNHPAQPEQTSVPEQPVRRAAPGSTGGTIRRDGNMARLRNTQDDSDPNATWNGNSTQQM